MGRGFAGDSGGERSRIHGLRAAGSGGATRGKRGGTLVWDFRVCVHDFRGTARSEETSADLADGASAGVDARTFVAGLIEFAADSISRRISFWWDVDARADVAVDRYGGKWAVWRGAAEPLAADNDEGCTAGNDL